MASLTDDQAQTTSYTYNSRGNKLTETYPDHTGGSPGDSTYGIVTFVYDNAGRVLRKQDQLGDTVTHTYDLAGRMTTRAYRTRVNSPSGTIADSDTFTFDRASRMLTAVNGRYTNTVTMTYDPIGRKATEGLTISGRTYTTTSEYNARGELTKLTYPDGSIAERTYHDTGALHLLKLDGSTISTRTYDDGRRLTGETLGNGVTETRTYSTDNLLTGISYGGTGTSIGNLSYTWDANKNKTSEGFGGTMSGYGFTSAGTTYDDEDRLTGYARTSGTFTQSWNLTKVGDWTSVTTNGTAQNRTHGPTHELLTAGGQSLATDPKGNITLLPTVLSSSLTPQASQLTPVARTGTGGSVVYVQHDQQTIADYPVGGVATTPTNRYVYASYIDEPVVRKAAGTSGTIHYYHRNQQYSITAMTTSTGAVAERYAYTAYGQPTILNASGTVLTSSAVGNRYTYTGREWDETLGLHHFRARWMSPLAGRFLGRDPIRYSGSEWDLYEFLDGAPLVKKDPWGLDAIRCWCQRFPPYSGGLGSPRPIEYVVETTCTGIAANCCRDACKPNGFTGRWEVEEAESDNSAEEEFKSAVMEIQLCCMPTGGAIGGYLACVKGTARVLRTKLGHYILEYTVDGVTRYAHMPGWDWIGDNVSCKGVGYHLEEVANRSPKLPIRHPDRILETKCVRNCFWTVMRCFVRAL